MREDKNLSLAEMATRMGVEQRTIKRDVAHLKQMGVVERVGANKNGYWVVLK
jgi:predicted DNA-binding transcriptional regulator YafY